MITMNIKGIINKFNPVLRETLEGAAGLCMSRGQYNVELEHWLLKVLDHPHTDLLKILEKYEVDADKFRKQLTESLDHLRTGSTRPPALSPIILDVAQNAWLLASTEFGHSQTTSAHLLTAIFLDDTSRRMVTEVAPCVADISPDSLMSFAPSVVGTTSESALALDETGGGRASGGKDGLPSNAPALDKYTINLTEKAKNGEIDQVLGRDHEIRQLIDILTRRRQNNPILTGEAGVGKTAVVEGFAIRLANNDVPTPLQNVSLLSLDLGLLQAGASVKGEFENRLKQVITEVKESPDPIIVFIDEAHTLIGAGGKEGTGDAANILKPALARGEFRTVAATTWSEYKKYFEKDPALTRRFQVVKVEEPDEENAINMMRGISKALNKHHNVRVLDEAIIASVKLSTRYIPARQLPDKSVSLLDTACARVALSQSSTPPPVEDLRRVITQCENNLSLLEKENAATGELEAPIAELQEQKSDAEKKLAILEKQWAEEVTLVEQVKDLRDKLEDDHKAENDSEEKLADDERTKIKEELADITSRLNEVQGDEPLIQADVDGNAVAQIVASWTGIPVGKMVTDEIQNILNMRDLLEERVVGQSHAMEAIAEAVRTSRAGLTDPRKPVGVFMMVGTSGTGKTETALTLAELLYGGEQNVVTINMSEFKEEHKVSMLLGASAGYVGYGEGGVLTEAVRKRPHSVVLLDEMEKAHPGIQDVFYNLFDKGTIKDGEGRDIDFKNTIIIMTSNACSNTIQELSQSGKEMPEGNELLELIRPELLESFRPAFLGRCTIVPYVPLQKEVLTTIVGINMRKIEKRVKENYGASFSYDDDLVSLIVDRCNDPDTGARNIENILSRSILPELAGECLQRMAEGQEVESVHIGTDSNGKFEYKIS